MSGPRRDHGHPARRPRPCAGYTFAGWFAAASGGSALTSPYTLAGSVTLYAQWIPNATDTITFNSQGGSAVANVSGPRRDHGHPARRPDPRRLHLYRLEQCS